MTAGQEGFVCVADDSVRCDVQGIAVYADEALVGLGAFGRIGDDFAVFVAQIFADDDSDIVEFKTLRGVYATDLRERVRVDCPRACVAEVPFCAETVFEIDVVGVSAGIVLACPFVAVPRQHTRLVVDGVLLGEIHPHLVGVFKQFDVEIEIVGGEHFVGIGQTKNTVEESDITVASVAPELGHEHHVIVEIEFAVQFLRPILDGVDGSDILRRDDLILVNEENADERGVDDFLDLVFADALEDARLCVESVRFVNDEAVESVGSAVHKLPGTAEQVLDERLPVTQAQLFEIDISRSGVFGHVTDVILFQRNEQIHCDHAFACAGTALNDDGVFFAFLQSLFDNPLDGGVDDLLFVYHNELFVAFEHTRNGVLKRFGGTNFAKVDFVEGLLSVGLFDEFFNEGFKLFTFVFHVERGKPDDVVVQSVGKLVFEFVIVIMEIGARRKRDVLVLNRSAEILYGFCVRIGLVRGMRNRSSGSADIGGYQTFAACTLSLLPLFQLDDHHVALSVFVKTGNHEVHTF